MDENEHTLRSAANPMADLQKETISLYQEYSTELTAYVFSMTHDQDLALDAGQEAFLRFFIERNYGRSIGNPRAWLYRVVRNYVLDRLDRATLKYEFPSEETPEMPDRNPDPEIMLQRSQIAAQITSVLTGREMECLLLRAEGLSYEETAQVLGIRPGTVSALLTRVHHKLREAAGDDGGLRLATAEALHYLFRGGMRNSP